MVDALFRQVRLPQHIVDLAADELRSTSGDHVDLRPRSYAVLRLLAENAGRLVTKDVIIAKVWDDVAVTEIRSLNVSPTFAKLSAMTTGACFALCRVRATFWSRRNAGRSSPAEYQTSHR